MATATLYDALIIGAGPAGLAAATGLARQLRTAVVFDSGVYRNAVSKHMHAVPGWDHVDPAVFRAKAREDLEKRYRGIEFKQVGIREVGCKDESHPNGKGFWAVDEEGVRYRGRTITLATGVRDVMPDIEGYEACWGRGIFHCLFCHGFEESGAASAGLLATDMFANPAIALHVGNMALNLVGKLTIYTNGNEEMEEQIRAAMAKPRTRVSLDHRVITKFSMVSSNSSQITLTFDDGTHATEGFLAHQPNVEINGPFVNQLGLELGSMGEIKTTPPSFATSVPGVFAAGDIATVGRAVLPAMSMGGMVAAGIVGFVGAEMALEEES